MFTLQSARIAAMSAMLFNVRMWIIPCFRLRLAILIKNTYQLQAIPGEELHVIYQFSVDNQPQGTGHISFIINKDTVQKFSGNNGNTTFYLPKN